VRTALPTQRATSDAVSVARLQQAAPELVNRELFGEPSTGTGRLLPSFVGEPGVARKALLLSVLDDEDNFGGSHADESGPPLRITEALIWARVLASSAGGAEAAVRPSRRSGAIATPQPRCSGCPVLAPTCVVQRGTKAGSDPIVGPRRR
jgi:hypothetical protein